MKPLTEDQKQKIEWHLKSNFIPSPSDNVIKNVIIKIDHVRSGVEKLSDYLWDDVTINDLIEDYRLTDYVTNP